MTFVPPLYDHKTDQVAIKGTKEAERLPWLFQGGTQDVQNSRTKVAEEVGRSQVAERRQEEGRCIAVAIE